MEKVVIKSSQFDRELLEKAFRQIQQKQQDALSKKKDKKGA